MNIINFPEKDDVTIKKSTNKNDNLLLKNFTFTCPSCTNKIIFNCSGMIFKTVELYCTSCGTKNKISNPGFK